MDRVLDTKTLTSSATWFEPPAGLGATWLAEVVARKKSQGKPSAEPELAFVPSFKFVVEQQSNSEIFATMKDVAALAAGYERAGQPPVGYPFSPASSAVESSDTITKHTLRHLLRAERRNKLLQRLSSERKATYERIRKLREEIGPLDFDVVEELRELRENG